MYWFYCLNYQWHFRRLEWWTRSMFYQSVRWAHCTLCTIQHRCRATLWQKMYRWRGFHCSCTRNICTHYRCRKWWWRSQVHRMTCHRARKFSENSQNNSRNSESAEIYVESGGTLWVGARDGFTAVRDFSPGCDEVRVEIWWRHQYMYDVDIDEDVDIPAGRAPHLRTTL